MWAAKKKIFVCSTLAKSYHCSTSLLKCSQCFPATKRMFKAECCILVRLARFTYSRRTVDKKYCSPQEILKLRVNVKKNKVEFCNYTARFVHKHLCLFVLKLALFHLKTVSVVGDELNCFYIICLLANILKYCTAAHLARNDFLLITLKM